MSNLHKLIGFILVSGCAGNQGTQPHDMSQAGHEQAAQEEESAASAHASMPENSEQECAPGQTWKVCWTRGEEHAAKAAKHTELASKHRAASAALAQAESAKCSGIDEEDRDISPFARSADIASVSERTAIPEGGDYVGPEPRELVGATVTFRAVPGLTREWLQRIVDCHIARAASVGSDMKGMDYCPLMVEGAEAKVRSAHGGFAVDITAQNSESVKEIVERAKALK